MTGQATTTAIAKFTSEGGEVSLGIAEVKKYFCPKATDAEAYMFLNICQYQRLNPFLREAYLIKYDDKEPASVIVGKDAFTKRAAQHPNFNGFEAGIVVNRQGEAINEQGSIMLPGDTLLGGWATVHFKDGRVPMFHTVQLEEYIARKRDGTPTKFWERMPATMIRKVALVQSLREAFPDHLEGLYDSAEIPMAAETIEGTSRIIPNSDEAPQTASPSLPDYGKCPEHNVAWQSKEVTFGSVTKILASHRIEGGGFHRLDELLRKVFNRHWQESHDGKYIEKDINDWLKDHYNATWSKLSIEEMRDAIAAVQGVDTETGEMPSDGDMGEVDDEDDAIMDAADQAYYEQEGMVG